MQDNIKNVNSVEYYDVDYTIEPATQKDVERIEGIEKKQNDFQNELSKFVSEVKDSGVELEEGQKFIKERSYDTEIKMLKKALEDKGKLTPEVENKLDEANNNLLNVTKEYQNLLEPQYAQYDWQIKMLSDMAIKQKEFVESPQNTVFDKNDFKFKISEHVPYNLKYDIDYDKILKDPVKLEKYSRLGPSVSPTFLDNLKNITEELDEKDMIDESNIKYEEDYKVYAGRKIFEARQSIASFFTPDPSIANDPTKLEEFYNKKADEFDLDSFTKEYDKYLVERKWYKDKVDACKEHFSKTGHATNIDVLRNGRESDAVITEDTHSSNILSGVFTMLKFYKKYEASKEENKKGIDSFLKDPGATFRSIFDGWANDYGNDQLKNKSRGEVLAKLDEISNSFLLNTDIINFQKSIFRFEECYTSMYPQENGLASLSTSMSLNLDAIRLSTSLKRLHSISYEENFSKVFTQLAVMQDKDYSPEKIASETYFDYKTNKYIEVPDNDMYIRDKKIDFTKAYKNAIDIAVDYSFADRGDTNFSMPTVYECAHEFASNMYFKHFYEMKPKEREMYKNFCVDAMNILRKEGIADLRIKTPEELALEKQQYGQARNFNDTIAKFETKAADFIAKSEAFENIDKELDVYEKFVVDKENKFNKDLANLQKDIEKAQKKGDDNKVTELREREENMKAKRIEVLIRDYNNGRLPETYALNRIQDILKGETKEVKGIFRTSGYKDAKSFCKANGLEDLSKEEMQAFYEGAKDEKSAYIQERAGVIEATPKIDIMEELKRHDQPEITRKVVEGLEQEFEEPEQNRSMGKSLDLYKNKEKVVDNNLAK